MPFRFLPDVALADIAFRARSTSLEGLFEEAAKALTEVMVDRKTLKASTTRGLSVSGEDSERLLYDFLTELIIMKDVDSLLFRDFSAKIRTGRKALRMTCTMKGEPIDRERHGLRNDVKAVTMHLFEIKKERRTWSATVVLDI